MPQFTYHHPKRVNAGALKKHLVLSGLTDAEISWAFLEEGVLDHSQRVSERI